MQKTEIARKLEVHVRIERFEANEIPWFVPTLKSGRG